MNPAIDVDMEIITIIDEESSECFSCQMTAEEAERARNGTVFFIYVHDRL